MHSIYTTCTVAIICITCITKCENGKERLQLYISFCVLGHASFSYYT